MNIETPLPTDPSDPPQNPAKPVKGLEVFRAPQAETTPLTSNKEVAKPLIRRLKSTKKLYVIAVGLLSIAILVSAAVLGLNKILFNLTTLHFVPADAEFYLGISVRNHPQVQKLKALTEKFPGGKKITQMPNFFRSELLGAPKDPFEDIVRLAEKEIFLAKVSKDSSQGLGSLEQLLNVVDLKSTKIATEKLDNFKKDTKIYTTSTLTFEDKTILDVKLNQKGEGSESYPMGALPFGVTLPYSKSIFATAIDKFIISGEKINDVKQAISLSKSVGILAPLRDRKLKNILSKKEHKQISKYFPKEYLLKFYQQKPLEPFSNLLPISSLSQSFLQGYDTMNRIEGENYIQVTRGLTITAKDNGVWMNSYQLDWRTPKESLKNPYKISDSLATRLPQKFSGISPAFFAETRNFKQLMADQEAMLTEVAEKSDNRNQRKEFKEAADGFAEFKAELRKTFGIDPDKDIFSWMEGQTALIFNAGAKNKAPELLIVAEIKDKNGVENSLKKLRLPNYIEERKRTATESDIRQIGMALEMYYADKNQYPKSLETLVPTYIYKLPKDPTDKPYRYTVSANLKSARVEGTLPDGRTIYFSSETGQVNYAGTSSVTAIKPLEPTKSTYKNVNLYSLPLYDAEGTKYFLVFAVTSKKAAIAFADSDQSIKDIIDFEEKPTGSLAASKVWRDQFSDSSQTVGGLTFIEPIGFFGTWEYYKNAYPEVRSYTQLLGESDLEIVLKGYLSTLKSIGTVVTKEKPVYATKTFVRIEELPKAEKDKAEDALNRLLDQTTRGITPSSVLGAATRNWSEAFKQLRDLTFP